MTDETKEASVNSNSNSAAIVVAVRVRPDTGDGDSGDAAIRPYGGDDAGAGDTHEIELDKEGFRQTVPAGRQFFAFDRVFWGDASQQDVFDGLARPFVDAAVAGFNVSVLAYGQTGSGKTFTMLGRRGHRLTWTRAPLCCC